jgi:hypothetical protein
MSKHVGNMKGWWDRVQQVMAGLVALSGEAAKVVDSLRQIFR